MKKKKDANQVIVNYKKELIRKSFHLIPALIAPIIYYFLLELLGFKRSLIISIFLVGSFAFLFGLHEIGLKKGFSEKVIIANQLFNLMKRDKEKKEKTFPGGWLYFTTIFLLALILHPFAALLGFSLSAFGDAAAALIGKKIGKKPNPLCKRKTIEGSIGFLVFGMIYGVFFFYYLGTSFSFFQRNLSTITIIVFLISLVGMLAESVPGEYYWDQLTVPLSVAIFTQIILKLPWFPLWT